MNKNIISNNYKLIKINEYTNVYGIISESE